MNNESPIRLSEEDRKEINILKEEIGRLCQGDLLQEGNLYRVPEYCDRVLNLILRLSNDLDELSLLYETMLDYGANLETEMINKMKKYLSTQLFKRIIGGEMEVRAGSHSRKKLTVFFSDVVGFSDITDSLDPENLSFLLNSYLDEMAIVANRWNGTIDKFMGDGIMIFFGDDDDDMDEKVAAKSCVLMALDMQKSMNKLRELWLKKGIHYSFKIRIGINSGYCTVGNFGSEERMDYTIIGGNVNIAARLEQNCPPGGVLISASTYVYVMDSIHCVSKGKIQVKGVSHPVETYQALAELTTNEQTSFLSINSAGFDLKAIHFSEDSPTLEKEEIKKSLLEALKLLESGQG